MTYTYGDYVIGIGTMPGLMKPCLFIGDKYCVHKVATFNSYEAKQSFLKWFEYFVNLRETPGEKT